MRCNLYAQFKIENYKQTATTVNFELNLTSLRKSVLTGAAGNTGLRFGNYFDESAPGNYALPGKDIIIALPAFSRVQVSVLPLNEKRIKGRPVINPSVKLEDSSLVYSSPVFSAISEKIGSIFKVKGYLWVRDYYCVDLSINQYRFNNADIINELKKVKIIFTINNPGRNVKGPPGETDGNLKKYVRSVIANYAHARPLDKKYYAGVAVPDGWINFGHTYLKMGVAADGIYRISQSDLLNYGIPAASINPKTFKLFVKGKEQPLYVSGENDDSFDDGDFIEFFGVKNRGGNYRETSSGNESYKEYLNRYSDTTIYWLTWGGADGLRIDTTSVTQGTVSDTLGFYSQVNHYEKNLYLDYSVPGIVDRQDPDWKPNETWVWGQQGVGTSDRVFNARDIYPGKTASAFFKVQDFASDITKNAHKIGLSINSNPTVYDSSAFDKYAQKVVRADFPAGLLNEGSNILKTISFPTDANINSIEYDWYEVEYPRYIRAINDSLNIYFDNIPVPRPEIIKIDDVNSNDITLYKYSGGLKKITNYLRTGSTIIFSDTVSNGDRYSLVPTSQIVPPKFYYKKSFTDLKSSSIQADYILITGPAFISKSNEYAGFISSNYGVTTKVINVNDIYDQFNYGLFAPEPIREFLMSANLHWKSPAPAYVFLVGDATYDYYGNSARYFGSSPAINYVPSFGHPVSDNWYVIWDTTGSLVQQMFIGRVPVNTVAEFDNYFRKHEKYLTDPFDKFNKTYLLFSGGQTDNPGELMTLRNTNEFIRQNIIEPAPVGGVARHLYKTANPVTNFGPYSDQQVAGYIAEGGVLISYLGHSGTQVWDNGIYAIEQLKNNSGKGSLISDWGCSTGKFAEPDIKSFSELFIDSPDGQAIAYTGNTSLGFLSTATEFPKLFYSDLLQKNITCIGQAHATAQNDFISTYGSSDVYRIFALCNTLFGDPIIKLKIPSKPNLSISNSGISVDTEGDNILNDSKDSVKVIIHYYNLGRADTNSFKINVKDIFNGGKIFDRTYSKILPLYKDSLEIFLQTKNLAGNHRLEISLDELNQVDEISETDNSLEYDINVASSSVRLLFKGNNNLASDGVFTFLSPVTQNSSDSLRVEYADNPSFVGAGVIISALDTLSTTVILTGLVPGKRYWMRYRFNSPATGFGKTISFICSVTRGLSYSYNDSVSFSGANVVNLGERSPGLRLKRTQKELQVSSAGFYDGSYGLISLDGTDYVTNSNEGGYHIAVFDEDSLKYEYGIFLNYYNDQANYETDFLAAIDSIPAGKIIAIAASDEPAGGLSPQIKSKLKSIGSRFIDSVGFRDSWGIITEKNYTPGKVIEGWARPYSGPVKLDTVFTSQKSSGRFETGMLGPAGKWNDLSIKTNIPANSSVKLMCIRVKDDGEVDTVNSDISSGTQVIHGLGPAGYPELNLVFDFSSSDSTALPELNSVNLGFKETAELGTNYKLVSLEKDSVKIGGQINLRYSVINAGQTAADSVGIKVDLVNPDNSEQNIFVGRVDSIMAGERKDFSLVYTTQNTGRKYLKIIIDGNNKINELYRDNNIYSVPFVVLPDSNRPDVKITFDDREIADNDFVSSSPKIKIELNDPSNLPVTDTSSISMSLNNKEIFYAGNPEINYKFNAANPKMTVEYSPDLLDGDYTFAVSAKNSLGNRSGVVTKQFVVSGTPRILDLYNYPNPFSGNTYFTFKLTRIPGELKIKIFTVAGRLIREFILHGADLHYGFNRIYWDGRDQDGDLCGNGVYLYKASISSGGKTGSLTQKLAIVR